MNQFAIEWVNIGEQPKLAERFWCEGKSGHLPFLVAATEQPAGDAQVDHNEFMLVVGLLYTWNDAPANKPLIDESARMQQFAKLCEGFGFVDVEGLITGFTHRMRLLYGHKVSCRLLRNGLAIFPDSSPIAADLSLDLGYILSKSRLPECKHLLHELLNAIDSLNEADMDTDIWQHLLVFKLAALKLIGSEQALADHLEQAIKDNITSPDLQIAINRLLKMTSGDVQEAFQPEEWTGLSFQAMEDHECDH